MDIHPLQVEVHIFSIGTYSTEDDMAKPESFNEIHRLGGFVNEQHDGRKDQPVTGADLYNVAVQLDSNFASLRSEIGNLRTDMNAETGSLRSDMTAEFKALRSEMTSEFKAVRAEMTSEFKVVRAEMKEGFAMMNLRFAELSSESSRTSWRAAGTAIISLVALLGIDRFWR